MRRLTVLLALVALPLGAAEPLYQPLAALVPDGAVVAVRIGDAAATWERLRGTPLAQAVWKGPIRRHLEETGRLAEIRAGLAKAETDLGISIGATLKQLAGEDAVLAVYPGDAPDRLKVGLFLRGLPGVDAGSILAGVLGRLVTAGELQPMDTIPVYDAEFRRFRNKKGDEFGVLAYGNHTLIANAVEIASGAGDLAAGMRGDSLLANPRVRETCEPLVPDSQLVAFLDVPRFIEVSHAPLDRQFARAPFMAAAIKAVKGIALGVSLRVDGVGGRLRIAADEAALPDFIRAYLARPDQPSAFARNLPRDAILAGVLAHLDLGAMIKEIMARMTPEAGSGLEQQLAGVNTFFLGGRSLTQELLPALGPDVGLLVTDLDPSDRMPADVTLLLKINDPAGREILASAARSLYGMTQFAPDPQEADKHSLKEEGDTVILASAQKNFTPCAIVAPEALIVGNSRAAAMQIKSWLANPPAESLASMIPPFKTGFMGADLTRLGAWVTANKTVIAADRVKKEGIAPERAEADVAVLGNFLTQFRALAVTGRAAPGAFEVVAELMMR